MGDEKVVKPTSNKYLMDVNGFIFGRLLGCLEAKIAKVAITKVRDILLRVLLIFIFIFFSVSD